MLIIINHDRLMYWCFRYLRCTFRAAADAFDPHVVVFLGDLFDEGSAATDKEFESYVQRLTKVFRAQKTGVHHVYVSGDNDVGGEGVDKRTAEKTERFRRVFHDDQPQVYKSLDFLPLHFDSKAGDTGNSICG